MYARHATAFLLLLTLPALAPAIDLTTPALRLSLAPDTGAYSIEDRAGGVTWRAGALQNRFGEIAVTLAGKKQVLPLGQCDAKVADGGLDLTFRPLADRADVTVVVTIRPAANGTALTFAYTAANLPELDSIRLLDDTLATTRTDQGYVLVPARNGLLIPADSGLAFARTFDTSAYEGCHMTMLGVVKAGATALLTWEDPYTAADVRSTLPDKDPAKQQLTVSLNLRKSASACTLRFTGKGDYVTIAKAYREVARAKGYLVPWSEKIKGQPDRAKLLGASNVKLWSTLSRTMSDDSKVEQKVTVNWTFDEAAAVAEHIKNDLKIDRVLFTLGGWIHRGYDNQHPDVLPAAPECGGDAKLAAASKRIMDLGYLLCFHDNYQDMYRDAPSWDESYLARTRDGKVAVGGKWAGGRCYLTCAQRAVDLAKRPQNLAAVRKLTGANSYFIDTTYAAGLQECFDTTHPLTRAGDMKWKQELSDYARGVFGVFGSECGREWAIPHSDFFEGLTGVSGGYYHNPKAATDVGGVVVPLFELVYRDTIQMYGKYGYDAHAAAAYVLHHISIGRPLNYHSMPSHLYWQNPVPVQPAVQPHVAAVKPAGPRAFQITYRWAVEKPLEGDWRVFVHFVDSDGKIRQQNDHPPKGLAGTGDVTDGPFTVGVPKDFTGNLDIRMGLVRIEGGARARLPGPLDKESRSIVGRLVVAADGAVRFEPSAPDAASPVGDPAMFVRGDNGWTNGLHPMDRFLKNTHEVLSPLNELTAQVEMTGFAFLSADHLVRKTTFGTGASAVEVVVNGSAADHAHTLKTGQTATLPPNGFVIESPTFVAFCATAWAGQKYGTPTLFTIRALDGKPIAESARVHVFHGFGDATLPFRGKAHTIEREMMLP